MRVYNTVVRASSVCSMCLGYLETLIASSCVMARRAYHRDILSPRMFQPANRLLIIASEQPHNAESRSPH